MLTVETIAKRTIGRKFDEADAYCCKYDCRIRVIKIDGKPCVGTRDNRERRINVELKNGIIIAYRIG